MVAARAGRLLCRIRNKNDLAPVCSPVDSDAPVESPVKTLPVQSSVGSLLDLSEPKSPVLDPVVLDPDLDPVALLNPVSDPVALGPVLDPDFRPPDVHHLGPPAPVSDPVLDPSPPVPPELVDLAEALFSPVLPPVGEFLPPQKDSVDKPPDEISVDSAFDAAPAAAPAAALEWAPDKSPSKLSNRSPDIASSLPSLPPFSCAGRQVCFV